jgi:hypothetical protein
VQGWSCRVPPAHHRAVCATSRLTQRGRSDKTLRSISALSAMTQRAFLLTVGFEHTAARRVLNEALFVSLPQTRAVLDAWRADYNRVRPHSALANRTPEEFRAQHISVAAAPATVKLYPRTLPMIGGKSGPRSRGYLARVRTLPAPTNHINGKWHSAAQLGSAFYGVPSLRNEKPIVECSSPEASKKRRARASYEALAAEAMKNRGARYGWRCPARRSVR